MNEVAARTNLLDLDRTGLEHFFADELGEKRFRAHQVMKWIYHRHVTEFAEMTDLGKALRAKLEDKAVILPPAVQFEKPALDGTHKWLLGAQAAGAIESVFIPDKGRGTLCVSSQVGCGLNCQFCSTATQGFNRNLSTAEIIGQVWVAANRIGSVHRDNRLSERRITNVVMMGMGEPLLNFDAVTDAMDLMRDDFGFGLANRRVTLSTAGLVPGIDALSTRCDVSLAVSLHAPTDELRDRLVPINRKHPLATLMAACVRYIERAPRDFVTFEYVMLDGVNDQPAHARALIDLVRDVPCKLNLIPFNPFPASGFATSPRERIRGFAHALQDAGLVATVRKTRGDDIDAACGQLAGDVKDRTRVDQRIAQQRTVMLKPVPAETTKEA